MLTKKLLFLLIGICTALNSYAQITNKDYQKGLELLEQKAYTDAEPFLKTALDTFKNQQDWESFQMAAKNLLDLYFSTRQLKQGISFGEEVVPLLEEKAPRQNLYQLYSILGMTQSRPNPNAAIESHKKELELLDQLFQRDSSFQYATAYNNLAEAKLNARRFEEATEYYQKAVEVCLATAKSEEEQSFLWSLYLNLGFATSVQGKSDQALAYYKDSEEVLRKFDLWEKEEGIRLSQMIAREYSIIGEPQRAIAHAKNILFRIEKQGLNGFLIKRELLSYTHTILALQYTAVNDFEEAIVSYQKIIELLEESGGADIQFMSNYVRLANAYIGANQLDSAQVCLEKADEIISRFSDEQKASGSYASSLRTHAQMWGILYKYRGEYEKAKLYFQKMLSYSKGFTRTSYSFLMDMSSLFMAANQLDSATYYNQLALEGACYRPDEIEGKLPEINNVRRSALLYKILLKRSIIETMKEGDRVARLRDALTYIDFSNEIHQENIRELNLFRGNSKVIVEKSILAYQEGLRLTQELATLEPNKDWVKQAFTFGQRKKAQKLWLSLLSSDAKKFANIPNEILEQEHQLQEEIQGYREQLQKAKSAGDTNKVKLYENDYLFEAEKRYQELIRNMEQDYPEFYQSKYQFEIAAEQAIQNQLKEDELLLDYVVGDSALYIFTIGRDIPLELQKVNLSGNLGEQINMLSKLLQNSPMNRPASRNRFIELSHELYQQLLAPIAGLVKRKNRLIILGDGLINYIPFEVLLASNEVKAFDKLDFLIKKKEVSYHYSVNLFLNSRGAPVKDTNKRLFAFAPVFDTKSEAVTELGELEILPGTSAKRSVEDGTFRALPESEKEVNAIAQIFASNDQEDYQIKLRSEADEATLKTNLAEAYQFIHIASHSFANLKEPRFSGIACFRAAENQREIVENGILYTGEIYNTNIKADLITLSSCESGYGTLDVSEGILGINRAFVYAGVPNVVYSLWTVYDKVSAQIMIRFYEEVVAGKDYATALQKAKLSLLENKNTASPHYWSPFLLIGR